MNTRYLRSALVITTALALQAFAGAQERTKWDDMDLGPFFTGCYKVNDTFAYKGIAVSVGTKESPAALLFDPELMRVAAVWEGGLAQLPKARGGLEGQIQAGGNVKISSGWTVGAGKVAADPREFHQGNLAGTKWKGIHLHGNQVVLSYVIGKQTVLESPGSVFREGLRVYLRTLTVGAGSDLQQILVAETGGKPKSEVTGSAIADAGGKLIGASLQGAPAGGKVVVQEDGKIVVQLPALSAPTTFQIAFAVADTSAAEQLNRVLTAKAELAQVSIEPGPGRWGAALETQGKLGADEGAYVADEITMPTDNPYKSWLRPGGNDFLPDGAAVVVNVSGDVWLVSGLDDKLEHVKWKRFASGLFQPLGCKVVAGKVYVLGRDQITRLHDLNNDGEADFYENFNNDCVVTENYHEFALDLQTDAAGNFYYGKGSPWTPTNMSPHQGTILKVSKDGAKLEVHATGVRAPNGLGMGPGDALTFSDNQGHWMPANRLNLVKKGGFYGMVPAGHREMTLRRPDGTEFKANPSSRSAREEFKTEFWGKADSPVPTEHDLPLCWIPMDVDNSPGGEVWAPAGNKWGPWGGHMLHMSYGKCSLFGVLTEKVDGVDQGALVRFPLKFSSGIQRGRFSPKDGQLYMTGLNVWQSSAAKDGCFYRVRYTGKPVTMPIGLVTKGNGVEIRFTAPLEAQSAADAQNWRSEQWNYKWTGNYGSPNFSAIDPKKTGKDLVAVSKATLGADKKSVTLELTDRVPAMQAMIKCSIKSADGQPVDYEIYSTVHRIPGQKAAAK